MNKKSIYFFFLFLLFFSSSSTGQFGGMSICEDLFKFIRRTLPKDSVLLELGSGWASGEFSKYYHVYSIEHDEKWIGKYNTNYIYAPIVNGWYDTEAIKKSLPTKYDMILIDGPLGTIGRFGFYNNLHLFNTNVTMIIDDVDRSAELNLLLAVAKKLNQPYKIFNCSDRKSFGVIEKAN